MRRPGFPSAIGSPLLGSGLVALALTLAACAPAPRDEVIDESEFYPVSGRTGQDLRFALNRLGPENDQGGRSDAVTRWRFEYAFGVAPRARSCALGTLDTKAVITTILPRWMPDRGAPPDLVRRFEDYVTCARLHETGHRRIYLDGIADFRRRAGALGDHPSCQEVGEALDALALDLLAEVQAAQRGYEERTDHGYRQCGHFP
jgi:predicted secreted Zn-dependent protease